jgi:hypothetical protein
MEETSKVDNKNNTPLSSPPAPVEEAFRALTEQSGGKTYKLAILRLDSLSNNSVARETVALVVLSDKKKKLYKETTQVFVDMIGKQMFSGPVDTADVILYVRIVKHSAGNRALRFLTRQHRYYPHIRAQYCLYSKRSGKYATAKQFYQQAQQNGGICTACESDWGGNLASDVACEIRNEVQMDLSFSVKTVECAPGVRCNEIKREKGKVGFQ